MQMAEGGVVTSNNKSYPSSGTAQMYGNPNPFGTVPVPAPRERTLADYEARKQNILNGDRPKGLGQILNRHPGLKYLKEWLIARRSNPNLKFNPADYINPPAAVTPPAVVDPFAKYYTSSPTTNSGVDVNAMMAKYYGQPVQMAEGGLYDMEEEMTQEEAPMIETAAQAPTLSPAMSTANPELNALLAQYTAGGTDYAPELRQARQDRKASEEAFSATLDKLMSSAESGPSKAEMYYRLAAAFGTPTKTGAFAEGLGQAGAAMADYEKESRGSQTAKRKLASEIALKKQELALEGAKDTEKTLLGLQSEANKDKREFIKATVKEYIDSGKPQSEAGRIAKDKGLKVGTPEYQKEVDKQASLLVEKQMAAINAQLLSGQATLAGLNIQQNKEQRESVKLEPDERKTIRDDEDAMHAANTTIKNIDEAVSLVDKAFTNTPTDKALYRKLKTTNPTDPRVIATEQLDNLLGTNALGSLKVTFGGNPTEGERNAMKELQGLSAASPASRKQILERAKKALAEGAEYRSMRINKIETGGYRKKPAKDKE